MFALVIVTVIIAYLFAAKCPNLQLTGTRSWRSILSAGLLREQRNDDNVDIDTTLENDLEHIEAESSKEQRAKVDRKITPKHCPASQEVVTQEVAVLVPRRGNLPRVSFSDPTWSQMTASRTSASSTTTNSRLQEQSQPLSQSLSSNGRGGAATPNGKLICIIYVNTSNVAIRVDQAKTAPAAKRQAGGEAIQADKITKSQCSQTFHCRNDMYHPWS